MRSFEGRLGVLVRVGGAMALVAVLAAWVHWKVGGATVALWVDDVATALAALAACRLCVRAARRHAGRARRFWALLAGASGAWAVAEVVWDVYDLLLDGVPTVSLADVGYLAAIPLAVAALLWHPAMRGGGAARKARATLDGLMVATALLFLSWTVVLGPLWDRSDLTTLDGIVALAYPFGDVVLMFFVVLAVVRMTGADRLSLWCLLAGLLAMALADSGYAYLTEVRGFESGGLLDVGWIAGYLGIALSALLARPAAVRAPEPATPPASSLLVPFVPVLLALGVLGVETRLGHRPDGVALLSALALVGLVLGRQALLMRDLSGSRKQAAAEGSAP